MPEILRFTRYAVAMQPEQLPDGSPIRLRQHRIFCIAPLSSRSCSFVFFVFFVVGRIVAVWKSDWYQMQILRCNGIGIGGRCQIGRRGGETCGRSPTQQRSQVIA
jgi:hypothetical protein